jgi:hypothetical protein
MVLPTYNLGSRTFYQWSIFILALALQLPEIPFRAITMRITDSQREKLQDGQEDLQSLLHVVEAIFDQNAEDTSSADLAAIGKLSESILETQKNLKALRQSL